MEYRLDKGVYGKIVMLKTANAFTDRAYIHLSQTPSSWVISFTPKEGIIVERGDFENELISQQLRYELIQETISELITDKYRFAIPIHASSEMLHDQITQSLGSFVQSIAALSFLSGTKAKIEVRVVGHKMNLNDLSATCRMLADASFRVNYINLIAMEVTGCCAPNRELLWAPYTKIYKQAKAGLLYAIHSKIDVGLYNFPLCTLPYGARPLAYDSITDWKIRYADECNRCSVKSACGGMFYSTYLLKLCKVNPVN